MANLVFRTIIIYISLTFALRVMGKKQAAQLQPYELVITLIISEVVSTPMDNPGTPISYGLIPAMTLLLLYYFFSFVTLKSKRLRAVFCGKPSILVYDGKINMQEVKRMNYNLNDLIEQMRLAGYTNIADVHYAILETNGQLSVLAYDRCSPVTPDQLDTEVTEEGICTALVIDGECHSLGVRHFKMDEKKVKKLLHTLGFSQIKQIILFTVSDSGEAFIQDRSGKIKHTMLPIKILKEEAESL